MKDKITIELLLVVDSVTTLTSPHGRKKSELKATIIDSNNGETNIDLPITRYAHLFDMEIARYRAVLTLEPIPNNEHFTFAENFPQSSD